MVNQKKTYTPIPKGATASCWKLAIIDSSDPDYCTCKVQELYKGPECPVSRFSRGGSKGAKYCTSNVTSHMEKYHRNGFGPLHEGAAEKKNLRTRCPPNKLIWHIQEKILVRQKWDQAPVVFNLQKCRHRQAAQMKMA